MFWPPVEAFLGYEGAVRYPTAERKGQQAGRLQPFLLIEGDLQPPNRLVEEIEMGLIAGSSRDGEGGIRTRDTTIFSRVLYQLSYLAATEHGIGARPESPVRWAEDGSPARAACDQPA